MVISARQAGIFTYNNRYGFTVDLKKDTSSEWQLCGLKCFDDRTTRLLQELQDCWKKTIITQINTCLIQENHLWMHMSNFEEVVLQE